MEIMKAVNKQMNYVVVRTETRVKNFTREPDAKSWIEKQKSKDGSRDSKGRVEYSIWESRNENVPDAE